MTSESAFSSVKGVCKVLGIFTYEKSSYFYHFGIVENIILIIVQLALIVPCLAYFVQFSSDVNVAAEVLSILFPSILHLGQYSILVFTKTNLLLLFKEFENLIQKSTPEELISFLQKFTLFNELNFNRRVIRSIAI